jgi:hypothetical protein
VDEDLKESFQEKRKLVLEMFNRMSKFWNQIPLKTIRIHLYSLYENR